MLFIVETRPNMAYNPFGMLRLLRVRNFALIDEIEIEFDSGFNLLSGETGAGKSLIVDALALVAGAKASGDTIRSGENRAVIEAVFDQAGGSDLESIGIDAADEIVIRREISSDNRNRVFINSQPSTVSALRAIAPELVDIHGQHEQQTLLDPARQLAIIDRAAGAAEMTDRVHTLYDSQRRLEDELSELAGAEANRLQRTDLLGYQRDEIEQVRPQAGETERLREQLRILEHGGKLAEAVAGGYETLYEAESSIIAELAAIERPLIEAEAYDGRLGAITEQIAAARSILEDAAFSLRDYQQHLETDPDGLESGQARLAELERLHRKYGPDLLHHLGKVLEELDSIGLTETKRSEVEERLATVRADYEETSRRLSRTRRKRSRELGHAVRDEIRSLAMPEADFSIGWKTLDPGRATGIDQSVLLLAPNPGEEAATLSAIASGGELSRTMLALRTVLAVDGRDKTLVFDEIDAGIGGEAAETLGRKLKDLSSSYQVLCVTHLPQVARFADRHCRIEKAQVNGRTVTRIEPLEGEQRVDELARMMSGTSISQAARRHVKELLKKN